MMAIDLAHVDKQGRALQVATDLAGHYGAELTFVGVTGAEPGALGHNPEEYADRLATFATEQAERTGLTTFSHAVTSHDPSTEMDDALLKAAKDLKPDLIVMQSHIPALVDYVWPSNGGKVAAHASCSIMVVRDG
nr:universal stress protein [Maritimibacter sp. DP1N21-5]